MTRGTHERIRDTAVELLITEGVTGFTIDELCRRSRVPICQGSVRQRRVLLFALR